jgi:hypothetical protein
MSAIIAEIAARAAGNLTCGLAVRLAGESRHRPCGAAGKELAAAPGR